MMYVDYCDHYLFQRLHATVARCILQKAESVYAIMLKVCNVLILTLLDAIAQVVVIQMIRTCAHRPLDAYVSEIEWNFECEM